MAKTTLLIEMIELLKRRPGITVSELGADLRRSERTIYRWLSELSGQIGAPVHFKDGGYYLSEHKDETVVRMTAEELVAMHAALNNHVFSDGSPLRKPAQSAWSKIRGGSAQDQLQMARDLSESVSVKVTVPKAAPHSDIVEIVQQAISSRRRLSIIYRSQKSNQVKQYLIEPYALAFRRHNWYLLANSSEHAKVVQFKMLRLQQACDAGTLFEFPSDFSVDEYFRLSWEAWAGGEPTLVRVRFAGQVADMVAEAKRHPTQRIHSQPDGSIIFEATVAGIEEIAIWIMGYGSDAEVLEPASLRLHIARHARAMADMYASEVDELSVPACMSECTDPRT